MGDLGIARLSWRDRMTGQTEVITLKKNSASMLSRLLSRGIFDMEFPPIYAMRCKGQPYFIPEEKSRFIVMINSGAIRLIADAAKITDQLPRQRDNIFRFISDAGTCIVRPG
jgi:hypothetical protein